MPPTPNQIELESAGQNLGKILHPSLVVKSSTKDDFPQKLSSPETNIFEAVIRNNWSSTYIFDYLDNTYCIVEDQDSFALQLELHCFVFSPNDHTFLSNCSIQSKEFPLFYKSFTELQQSFSFFVKKLTCCCCGCCCFNILKPR